MILQLFEVLVEPTVLKTLLHAAGSDFFPWDEIWLTSRGWTDESCPFEDLKRAENGAGGYLGLSLGGWNLGTIDFLLGCFVAQLGQGHWRILVKAGNCERLDSVIGRNGRWRAQWYALVRRCYGCVEFLYIPSTPFIRFNVLQAILLLFLSNALFRHCSI